MLASLIRPTVALASEGGVRSRSRFLMGAPLAIEATGDGAEEAIEAAFAEVARLDDVLSNWHDSELVRLNERAAEAPVRCSEDLYRAVAGALRWAEETEGAFDPTIETIVRRLGLRGGDGRLPGPGGEPSVVPGGGGGQITTPADADGKPPIGWRLVRLDPAARTVAFAASGVALDLGGIGKGIALDAALSVLRARGVVAALLDFGGQLLAFGPGPDDGGWLVGVADPLDRSRSIGVLSLREASLATSSQRERGGASGREPVGHVLDPRSGAPARFDGTVAVLSPDATSADALSTALLVMGPRRGLRWAEHHDRDVLFLSRDSRGRLVRRGTGRLDKAIADVGAAAPSIQEVTE
jgi:thiamine biosynthesis lipoprotein